MDVPSLGVFQNRRNIVVRSPARRGPFCSCPTRLEIDADDIQAEMIDMERVQRAIEHFRNKFINGIPNEYFYP